MSTILDQFQQAQLAEAAYADFLKPNITIEQALRNEGFSESQATAFVAHWKVVDQYPAPLTILGVEIGSGFSGTLFQRIDDDPISGAKAGEYSFAVRGTAGATDLVADASDVLTDGIALDQVVDMYNYWQRLTKTNYQVAMLDTLSIETAALSAAYLLNPVAGLAYELSLRARADIVIDYPSRTVRTIHFDLITRTDGLGLPVATVDVAGHSLGGHLAMVFSRLFHSATAQATAVNGAGFGANINVNNLLAMLGGAATFDASKITNAVGSAAMNLVSQDWLFLQQPAGRQEIYTEAWLPGSGTMLGHGSGQMTDSLAVYNLLATLDSSLNTDPNGLVKITGILKAASNIAENSLESTISALGKLFSVPGTTFTSNEFDRK